MRSFSAKRLTTIQLPVMEVSGIASRRAARLELCLSEYSLILAHFWIKGWFQEKGESPKCERREAGENRLLSFDTHHDAGFFGNIRAVA